MSGNDYQSPYTPNTDHDRQQMLEAIGVSSVEELFKDIPEGYTTDSLDLPPALSEPELMAHAQELAASNMVPGDYACFLGAGVYRHHIPAVVRQITGRSEFMTAYTPYQPEVSQGTLQTAYEFQTLVSQLTGMEVANLGMYDGSTSMAEAALMSARITKFDRISIMDTVSPLYREVLDTYAQAPGLKIDTFTSSQTELEEGTACLIVQQPNFFGYMEDMAALSKLAHDNGALLIVSSDPISLAMFKPPGDYDADIVVGEGQPMGVPPTFGGPFVGLFACKQEYIRQMPGRIVGKTVDTKDRTAYVLTLQTREQHIRRERATSNICTAVALIALMSTVYMSSNGKRGMRHVAELCYHKAHYAATLIDALPGYSVKTDETFFQEFVVECPSPPSELNEKLLGYKIIGGLDITAQVPNGMLVCATEVNTRDEIERLAGALAEIGTGK